MLHGWRGRCRAQGPQKPTRPHQTEKGQFQGVLNITERISSAFTVNLGQKISGILRKNGHFLQNQKKRSPQDVIGFRPSKEEWSAGNQQRQNGGNVKEVS